MRPSASFQNIVRGETLYCAYVFRDLPADGTRPARVSLHVRFSLSFFVFVVFVLLLLLLLLFLPPPLLFLLCSFSFDDLTE